MQHKYTEIRIPLQNIKESSYWCPRSKLQLLLWHENLLWWKVKAQC